MLYRMTLQPIAKYHKGPYPGPIRARVFREETLPHQLHGSIAELRALAQPFQTLRAERAQLSSHPDGPWQGETHFRPVHDLAGQQVTQGIDQKLFGRMRVLSGIINAKHEFHEFMVEEWHAHLQGMGHAHLVGIAQKHVLQVGTQLAQGDL
jgi:hypothetical protein